jgi:hypothetical protein
MRFDLLGFLRQSCNDMEEHFEHLIEEMEYGVVQKLVELQGA